MDSQSSITLRPKFLEKDRVGVTYSNMLAKRHSEMVYDRAGVLQGGAGVG